MTWDFLQCRLHKVTFKTGQWIHKHAEYIKHPIAGRWGWLTGEGAWRMMGSEVKRQAFLSRVLKRTTCPPYLSLYNIFQRFLSSRRILRIVKKCSCIEPAWQRTFKAPLFLVAWESKIKTSINIKKPSRSDTARLCLPAKSV